MIVPAPQDPHHDDDEHHKCVCVCVRMHLTLGFKFHPTSLSVLLRRFCGQRRSTDVYVQIHILVSHSTSAETISGFMNGNQCNHFWNILFWVTQTAQKHFFIYCDKKKPDFSDVGHKPLQNKRASSRIQACWHTWKFSVCGVTKRVRQSEKVR